MCGIFGFFYQQANTATSMAMPVNLQTVLHHRGPDDFGCLAWDGRTAAAYSKTAEILHGAKVGLVHWRLSILDLSSLGAQPMSTPDGRYHIIFNGEIYNFQEVRKELEALGWSFRSHSDTEVLLYGYAQWGADLLPRLTGMFSFAVLDTVRHRLFLARDFFGIKPLFYSVTPSGLAFASEIKALLASQQITREANPARLYDYLRFGLTDHGEETLFAAIKQLPPAHYMEFSVNERAVPAPVRYWHPTLVTRYDLTFDAAAEQLRALFLDSVRLHLRSDVPVGAALSGGIDSSSIVMAMRHLEPGVELHTFSYLAEDPRINEESWVDIVGLSSNATMHKVQPSVEDLVNDLDDLIETQGEPFGSTSIYAQYRVFRLAREAGIKVMLDGQGADELLGGYTGYLSARLATQLVKGQLPSAIHFARQAGRLPHVDRRNLWMRAAAQMLPVALKPFARRFVGKDLAPAWLNVAWFDMHGVTITEHVRPAMQQKLRQELQYDIEHGLMPLLRYEDRNSMRQSIESRVPFLTPQIAQFLYSVPEEYLIDGNGVSKAIFRKAMRGIVPDVILDRQDKIGFQTPEKVWLQTIRPYVGGILNSETAHTLKMLNPVGMQQDWQAVLDGKRPFDFRVWRWINLIRWSELYEVKY